MRVVGYVRADPDVDGRIESLLIQKRTIWQACVRERHAVIAWFVDEADGEVGRAPERTGLAGALGAVRRRRADGLAVASLVCLATDVIFQEHLLAALRRLGGTLLSADPADAEVLREQPADAGRALVRRTLATMREHERALRELRVREERAGPTSGDHDEAASLMRIEQLAEEGLSLRDIARRLTTEGFSPRFSHLWDPRRLLYGPAQQRRRRPIGESRP